MFLNPIGLIALAALPAIAAIYYFRRRFEPRLVSALFLWHLRDRVPAAGRRFERLRSSTSLWLEMLAALLLTLALAGLRIFGEQESVHFVAVLDGSASMLAKGKTEFVRDRALAAVRQRIQQLSPRASVTIIESGAIPHILAGPAAFPKEAILKLEPYQPFASHHDLTASLSLAQQLAGAGAILLVTDKFDPGIYPKNVEVVSVGEPLGNVGFTHVARTREKAFFTIANFSDQPKDVVFTLRAAEKDILTKTISLPAGERKSLALELPPDSLAIEGVLPADALAADNRVFLVPPPKRTLQLAADPKFTDKELYLLGLSSAKEGAGLDQWKNLVPDSEFATNVESAHLYIGREMLGSARTWGFVFEAPGAERKDWIGPFLIDKRHPLLEGVTLDGVVWSADPKHQIGGYATVSAGNDPILTELRDGDRRVYRFNCDFTKSTLHKTPDWPILLTNFAETRRDALPGPPRVNLVIGESFVFRAAGEGQYKILGPGGPFDVRGRETVIFDGIANPGLFTFTRSTPGAKVKNEELCQFSVNFFDAAESDLRGRAGGVREGESTFAKSPASFSASDILLILAALSVLLVDWYLLARASRRAAFAL
ncbi:MAG: vWA domain-containing protein [Planctomycetota bacterium]